MTTILERIDSLASDLAEIAKRTPAKHRHRIAQIADLMGVVLDYAYDGGIAQSMLSRQAEDLGVTPVTNTQPQHRRIVQSQPLPAAPQTEVKPNRRRLPMDRLLAFLATRARGATIEEVSQALGVSYTTTSSKLKLAWQGGRLRRSGMPLRYYAVNTKEPLPDLPQK